MGLGLLNIGCCACAAPGPDASTLLTLSTSCPSGGDVTSVAVTLTNAGLGYSQTRVTDALGQATFTGLTIGQTYAIAYSVPGYGAPRWYNHPDTILITSHAVASGSMPLANAPAGYVCSAACNLPLSNRMHLVAALNPAATTTETVTLALAPGTSDDYSGVGGSGYTYHFTYNVTSGDWEMDSSNPQFPSELATRAHNVCLPFNADDNGFRLGAGVVTYWQVTEATPVP